MELIKLILGSCFVIVTALLILNGLHRYITIYRYFKVRNKRWPKPAPLDRYPKVTVQLPLYNEHYVAERVLNAVAEFDYPKDKLEIQVLDDSTD